MGELAGELIRQINPSARIQRDNVRLRPENSEVERLLGSNKKLKSLTSREPKYGLSRELAETIDWFREPAHLNKYRANIYNIQGAT